MYKIFIKEHSKKVLLTFIGIFLLAFVTINIVDQKYKNSTLQYIPKNIIYFEANKKEEQQILKYLDTNNIEYDKTIDLSNENTDFLVSSLDNAISLKNLTYTNETTSELMVINQKNINNRADVIQTSLIYNLNSQLLTDDTYIKNNPYNIEKVIGSWPKNNKEVLISENIAMSLLTEYNLKTYEQLIGKQVELANNKTCSKNNCFDTNFTITGIYKKEDLTDGKEYYITSPTPLVKDDILGTNYAYIAKINDKNELVDLENNYDLKKLITYKDNEINIKLIINISTVLLSNLFIILLLFSEFKNNYLKLRFIGKTKIVTFFSLSYLLILFNTFLILLELFMY